VVASGDKEVVADAKVWDVEYDPTYENSSAIADTTTTGTPGSTDDPKSISTTFTAVFEDFRNTEGKVRTSDGIRTSTKEARLLVVGLHELSHGSEGNRAFNKANDPEGIESERDVGTRIRNLIRYSPTIKDGYR
jgi:hypothetical protein